MSNKGYYNWQGPYRRELDPIMINILEENHKGAYPLGLQTPPSTTQHSERKTEKSEDGLLKAVEKAEKK